HARPAAREWAIIDSRSGVDPDRAVLSSRLGPADAVPWSSSCFSWSRSCSPRDVSVGYRGDGDDSTGMSLNSPEAGFTGFCDVLVRLRNERAVSPWAHQSEACTRVRKERGAHRDEHRLLLRLLPQQARITAAK